MSFHLKAIRDSDTIAELLTFLRENKRWFLQPVVIVLLLLAALILLAQSSAIAPFIYALY
ncbi:MAG TPA: DUF5989 family protein [Candidatus Binatia bacterium]|nr:DUF5989 family protein [Candidatus Binatia bacterium]